MTLTVSETSFTMPKMTTHPSRAQLTAYNLGQLPPDQATEIESHIGECEPCCDTIINLVSPDRRWCGGE